MKTESEIFSIRCPICNTKFDTKLSAAGVEWLSEDGRRRLPHSDQCPNCETLIEGENFISEQGIEHHVRSTVNLNAEYLNAIGDEHLLKYSDHNKSKTSISLDEIKFIFQKASDAINGIKNNREALADIKDTLPVNPQSTRFYFYNIINMAMGGVYKRNMNAAGTEYILEKFRDDFDKETFSNALTSVELHLDYYKSKTEKDLPSIREIFDRFIEEKIEDAVMVDPIENDIVKEIMAYQIDEKGFLSKEQQTALIKKSVTEWNLYRIQNRKFIPDLSEVDLSGVDLFGANLNNADLIDTKFKASSLIHTEFKMADLTRADFGNAVLNQAQLSYATLYNANFFNADLTDTNLEDANLMGADLCGTDLTGANLSRTDMRGTNAKSTTVPKTNNGLNNLNEPFHITNLFKVKNLTQPQIDVMSGDSETLIPNHLTRPNHWNNFGSDQPVEPQRGFSSEFSDGFAKKDGFRNKSDESADYMVPDISESKAPYIFFMVGDDSDANRHVENIMRPLIRDGISCYEANDDTILYLDDLRELSQIPEFNGIDPTEIAGRNFVRDATLIVSINTYNNSDFLKNNTVGAYANKKNNGIIVAFSDIYRDYGKNTFQIEFDHNNPEQEYLRVVEEIKMRFQYRFSQIDQSLGLENSTIADINSDKPFVFISHANKDKEQVEKIIAHLNNMGLKTWWDSEISTGEKWRAKIAEQLDDSSAVLTLWTKNSVESSPVCEEAQGAISNNKFVHAKLEDVGLPFGFSEVQFSNIQTWDGDEFDPEMRKLVQALKDKLYPKSASAIRKRLASASKVSPIRKGDKISIADTPINTPPVANDNRKFSNRIRSQKTLANKIIGMLENEGVNIDRHVCFNIKEYLTAISAPDMLWNEINDAIKSVVSITEAQEKDGFSGTIHHDILNLIENTWDIKQYLEPEQIPLSSKNAPLPAPILKNHIDLKAEIKPISDAISKLTAANELHEFLDEKAIATLEKQAEIMNESYKETSSYSRVKEYLTQKLSRSILLTGGFIATILTSSFTEAFNTSSSGTKIIAAFNNILNLIASLF